MTSVSAALQRAAHKQLLEANGGSWFDFEGLIRDIYVLLLKPGDLAIDVGVNVGTHFLQMLEAVGPTGRVVGFEASTEMAKIARQNASQLYGTETYWGGLISNKRWQIHEIAISSKTGSAQFSFDADAPGLSSLTERAISAQHRVVKSIVKTDTLDNLLKRERKIAFAKIDIEGAEYHALLGGTRLFKDKASIVFEFDAGSPASFGFDPTDLLRLFEDNQYEVHDFFGYQVSEPIQLMEGLVWNYYAAPKGSFATQGIANITRELVEKLSHKPQRV